MPRPPPVGGSDFALSLPLPLPLDPLWQDHDCMGKYQYGSMVQLLTIGDIHLVSYPGRDMLRIGCCYCSKFDGLRCRAPSFLLSSVNALSLYDTVLWNHFHFCLS